MGEKDKAERMLENYADVFADIVNVLMFGGKRLISPDELVEVDARSQFKADDGVLHEQERDVVKRWKHGKIVIAPLGEGTGGFFLTFPGGLFIMTTVKG